MVSDGAIPALLEESICCLCVVVAWVFIICGGINGKTFQRLWVDTFLGVGWACSLYRVRHDLQAQRAKACGRAPSMAPSFRVLPISSVSGRCSPSSYIHTIQEQRCHLIGRGQARKKHSCFVLFDWQSFTAKNYSRTRKIEKKKNLVRKSATSVVRRKNGCDSRSTGWIRTRADTSRGPISGR